ncbi:MAG: TonB-dependent receptor [Chitinophagaceae bacterium]
MKKIIIIFGLCCLCFVINAQNLKGKVFGKTTIGKEILVGATIAWLGTNTKSITNENGVFEITLNAIINKQLIVSFIGFKTDTITINEQQYISVNLTPIPSALADVVVNTSKQTAFIANGIIKTEVITQKELTKAACCDLAGCFETQASVQPQTTNVVTNSKELRILGLNGTYNQLLFDGMPMIQGLSFTYGINSYPGTLVDNIFVAKGANSVLQGFESISGQINVIPKTPTTGESLLLNMYTNNFMEKHFNINYATKLGKSKKWSTLLAVHSVQPANRIDRDKDLFLDLPLLTRYMVYNNWKYGSETEKGFYTHIGLRYLNEERIGGQTNFNANEQKGSTTVYGQTVNYTQPEIYTKSGFRFNEKHAIAFQLSAYTQNQDSYFGTVKYTAKQQNIYANLQHEFAWKENHLLKYGLSFRYNNIDEIIDFTDFMLNRTYDGLYNTKQVVPGIFAENVFNFLDDKLIWIVGARLDNHQQYGNYFTPRTLVKYSINDKHTFRASIGTGWRQVNLFSENINLLASSRNVIFNEQIKPEQALNWGINYTYKFKQEKFEGYLSTDFYQTSFSNQFFPDYDSDPTKAFIYNYTGKSISNAFQIDANVKFNSVLEFKTSYNFLDVFRMENGVKNELPFNAKNKVIVSLSYRPKNNKWYIDINMHWYDRQRLPNTSSNPVAFQLPNYSNPYSVSNIQITHKIKQVEVYVGMENIFDFRQLQPILSWQNPFGKYFDTSSVWGPTRGREMYIGFRWKIKN